MRWFIKFKFALVLIVVSEVSAIAEVLAARTLRVGSIVEKADLDVSNADGSETALVGKEVKRAIYAGRPITRSDVGPVTVVDRNEVIRLFYYLNGLGIRTEARALEAGGVGEEITVMNIDTRVTVRAEIIDSKRARVSK